MFFSLGWSRKEFNWPDIKNMLSLGVASAMMLIAEVFAFDFSVVAAGWLGPDALATHTVLLNTLTIVFMVPLGLAIATTIRVGHLLGENEPKKAKFAGFIAVLTSGAISLGLAVALLATRNVIGLVYTDSVAVCETVAVLMPIGALLHVYLLSPNVSLRLPHSVSHIVW